jgi:hypothetical protein
VLRRSDWAGARSRPASRGSHLQIIAGAGSCKTEVVAPRVVQLIADRACTAGVLRMLTESDSERARLRLERSRSAAASTRRARPRVDSHEAEAVVLPRRSGVRRSRPDGVLGVMPPRKLRPRRAPDGALAQSRPKAPTTTRAPRTPPNATQGVRRGPQVGSAQRAAILPNPA